MSLLRVKHIDHIVGQNNSDKNKVGKEAEGGHSYTSSVLISKMPHQMGMALHVLNELFWKFVVTKLQTFSTTIGNS